MKYCILYIFLFAVTQVNAQMPKHQPRPVSVSAGVTYATLNPADKAAGVTLGGGNLSATFTATYSGVRTTIPIVIGTNNYYWEAQLTTVGSSAVGIATIASTLSGASWPGFDAESWVYFPFVGNKAHSASYTGYAATCSDGDWIAFKLSSTGDLELLINNVSQGIMYSGLTGTVYPVFSSYADTLPVMATNFGTSFHYTPPVGYVGVY